MKITKFLFYKFYRFCRFYRIQFGKTELFKFLLNRTTLQINLNLIIYNN